MLSGVFHLHEQEARQVMTPIPAVVTVDISEDVETALRRCVSSGHTRLSSPRTATPTGQGHRPRELAGAPADGRGADALIEPVVKDAPIVPETKPLDDLLADLQRERATMAVVVDEYGRTAGIVTVEDIIEEVVGEIDRRDRPGRRRRPPARQRRLVRARPRGDHRPRRLRHRPPEAASDAYNSVGGFVFGELGRLPKRGDMVRANGYSMRVEAVRENRVEAVRIRDHEPDSRNGRRRRESDEESVREGG